MQRNKSFIFLALAGLLLAAFILDLFTGNAAIPVKEAWAALRGSSEDAIVNEIIRNYRLPKAITAVIAAPSRTAVSSSIRWNPAVPSPIMTTTVAPGRAIFAAIA